MNNKKLKKLAEFAGFQWLKATDGKHHWFGADGNIISPTDKKGNVIWDMNACWQWLMPKYTMQTGKDFITIPTTLSKEETAKRICKAIEQLIEKEEKENE